MTIDFHWFGKQIITSANNDAVQRSIYASSCPNMLTHKMPMNTFHKTYFLQKIISYCCRHSACIPDLVFAYKPWTVMFMIYNTRHEYSCWPMWQSNVSDFPQQVFKASSLQNLLKFLIKWSFMNWQLYMRLIYWQAMPKVKKKSDKQRQRFYKVRKRYERATNEKEVQVKYALNKANLRDLKAATGL